jgi:ABC-type hemin transport system ATPase subunit
MEETDELLVAVVGRAGAGKTCLVTHLSLALTPQSAAMDRMQLVMLGRAFRDRVWARTLFVLTHGCSFPPSVFDVR